MRLSTQIQARWHRVLDDLALRLSGTHALHHLGVLAVLVGLIAGVVTIGFRVTIEQAQIAYLPGGVDKFESLAVLTRLLLPIAGGLLIGLIWQSLARHNRQVGVAHVITRLAYHHARLPLRNAVAQFVGAALSIIFGHSVGREGPSVHLGAASGSGLGRWLRLPNNHIRTLVACGVAGAIAASFNTPLAGVIFAMEVVMMEYTIAGFAPVILAAVSATTLSRWVFGPDAAFVIPAMELESLLELPYIVIMGLLIGSLAALFIHLLQRFTGLFGKAPVWLRCTLGGAAVGLIACLVPEVMGIGYDTVDGMLLGNIALSVMIAVALAKLLATAAALGLGLPGGLIGPTLVIGAAAGGAMGTLANAWLPGSHSSPAFYALIGMGAMMGATLQAPLAALTAMLELTANPNIILPGMLAVISAGAISKEVFKKDSVYLLLMQAQGMHFRDDPLMQTLRRMGVVGAMERRVTTLSPTVTREELERELAAEPRWILLRDKVNQAVLLPAADVARSLKETDATGIDLANIPAKRLESASIDFQATLQEALERLDKTKADAVHVVRRTVPGIDRVYGVLTRQDIENSYRL